MISRRAVLGHLLAAPAVAWAVPTLNSSTLVRWLTKLGPIDLQLYDTAAPLTVANFLGYVNRGAYLGSFFHRSIPGFVVQGGGFVWPSGALGPQSVVKGATVANEFNVDRSNLRGTIAMAKLGSDPNSATSEWFVNLGNNAANLDHQNGGFTVFGRVTSSGMAVFDKIAALRIVNAGGVYTDLPVIDLTSSTVGIDNVVRASAVSVLPGAGVASDSDRIFNHLEGRYPQYVPVSDVLVGTAQGYYFRYYPRTDSYVGTKEGNVHYLVPSISPDVQLLGSMAEWLAQAAAEGY